MRSEHISLNGQSFFVRSWGDASQPPLLMLHGFPEYGGAWSDLAERLSDRFHCVAPDQRGYGQSWAPPGVKNYAIAQLVSDMVALIDRLGGRVTLLGHDWGAAVAYGITTYFPDRIERLIIGNGVHPVPFQRELAAGGAQSEASEYIAVLRAEGSEDRLSADGFSRLKRLFSAKMSFDWMSPEIEAQYITEWSRPGRLHAMLNWYRASPLVVARPGEPITYLPPLPEDRLHVRCPHLLLWGMRDKALQYSSTDGLEHFAEDLMRVTFDDADHWLFHQIPEACAASIRDWCPT
ncbi:MAG: alpha/beta hydrolase [Pseudomonadota bacterium]